VEPALFEPGAVGAHARVVGHEQDAPLVARRTAAAVDEKSCGGHQVELVRKDDLRVGPHGGRRSRGNLFGTATEHPCSFAASITEVVGEESRLVFSFQF
jgi:hypothetical protein